MTAAQYDPASETPIHSPVQGSPPPPLGGVTKSPDLRILHFNDVYHIQAGSVEPIGGVARFQSVVNYYRNLDRPSDEEKDNDKTNGVKSVDLITLFSGDVFNPSLESSVTKGQHMVPVLNRIGVDATCVGNHDLDFGVTQFRHLRDQCKFPWLFANVLDPALGKDIALGGCPKTTIIQASNGIKIGLIGLAEREWLDTVNSLPPNLVYQSASETAKRLVPDLRTQGAEIVIALTHQREPNDVKLAEKTPPGLIDIILGGHDHFYGHQIVNGTHVLRSGTDFKQLSYIEANRRPSATSNSTPLWDFTITRRDITRPIPEEPTMVKLVNRLTSNLMSKLEKPIGYTAVPLDGRFNTVRTKESNLGNFVCDLMRHFYSTDCALMAAGTIRGDQIYPPGLLRLKDLMNCFPFEDPVVVLRVSGQAIWTALENSVCLVPALEGRFPQVSNISFAFDPSRTSGSRVVWAKIENAEIDREKMYTMATRGYTARGKDGFSSLLVQSEPGGTAEEIVSEENGILISTVLKQYFMSLKVLGKWARWSPSLNRHWTGVNEVMDAGGKAKPPVGAKSGMKRGRSGSVKANAAKKRNVEGRSVARETEDEQLDGEDDEHDSKTNGSRNGLSASIEADSSQGRDRSKHLARVYTRLWMKLARIERHHADVVEEEHSDDWTLPHWTHGIAPKLDGRIVMVQNQDGNRTSNGKVK